MITPLFVMFRKTILTQEVTMDFYFLINCSTSLYNRPMTLNEELFQLRQKLKLQEKEIRRLKKENDFLEEASAFFAASRLKSAKTKE